MKLSIFGYQYISSNFFFLHTFFSAFSSFFQGCGFFVSLYSCIEQIGAIQGKSFLGGDKPLIADLAVFGVLRSIKGTKFVFSIPI